MGKLELLEREIATLPPTELAQFRDWFATFDAVVWDAQIETDATNGKLDALASKALAEYGAGKALEI